MLLICTHLPISARMLRNLPISSTAIWLVAFSVCFYQATAAPGVKGGFRQYSQQQSGGDRWGDLQGWDSESEETQGFVQQKNDQPQTNVETSNQYGIIEKIEDLPQISGYESQNSGSNVQQATGQEVYGQIDKLVSTSDKDHNHASQSQTDNSAIQNVNQNQHNTQGAINSFTSEDNDQSDVGTYQDDFGTGLIDLDRDDGSYSNKDQENNEYEHSTSNVNKYEGEDSSVQLHDSQVPHPSGLVDRSGNLK